MMSSKTKQYEMDMCSGPILRKMLMFALPLMLSSILQLLFNAADIVVVASLPETIPWRQLVPIQR